MFKIAFYEKIKLQLSFMRLQELEEYQTTASVAFLVGKSCPTCFPHFLTVFVRAVGLAGTKPRLSATTCFFQAQVHRFTRFDQIPMVSALYLDVFVAEHDFDGVGM